MAGFFRIKVFEKDLSGFVRPIVDEQGAIVGDFHMGPGDVPINVQDDQTAILYFGYPNATKPGMFEVVPYTRQAPCWVLSAIGSGALYAGVDVLTTSVATFGTRTGRDYGTFSPASVSTNKVDTVGTGDGITKNFTGTLSKTPVVDTSYKLYAGGIQKASTESAGIITGADATGTLSHNVGTFSITFTGVAGTPAEFESSIITPSTFDLSIGGKPKAIKLTIDQTVYDNLSFGSSATASLASVVSAINVAVGYTAAEIVGDEIYASDHINITAILGSSTLGQIIIAAPSDTTTYDSAVNLIFATTPATLTQTTAATNPTGAVPRAGQTISVDYIYTHSLTTTLSHSIFAFSQYADTTYQLAGTVAYNGGYKYTLTLYTKIPVKGYAQIDTYAYSLIREKDNFGRSLYYADVFKNNPYIKFYVNPSFTASPADPVDTTTIIDFTGGNRGATPLTSDFTTAWNTFQKAAKYPTKIFMDIYGGYASTLQSIIQNYQRYSMGISMIPPGNNAAAAVLYRQSTSVDDDNIVFYTNWYTIVDPYNNSFAFVSQVGKVGVKWAQMQNVFDGLPPAGIDENGHGGQLIHGGFNPVEAEFDYTETELEALDNAQINPIVFDPIDGVKIVGNRTAQVQLSDTSYIHTRRIYNFILDNTEKQVLKRQVFKLNDDIHRLQVKSLTEAIVFPLKDAGLLNDVVVVCDASNNTKAILDQRKFIVDIYVQAAADSEFVQLNMIRLSQQQVISDIIGN